MSHACEMNANKKTQLKTLCRLMKLKEMLRPKNTNIQSMKHILPNPVLPSNEADLK